MTNYGAPPATPTTSNGRHDQAGIPPQPAGWRGLNEMADEFGIVLNEEILAEFEGEPALVVDRLDAATYGQPLLVGDDGPAA